MLPLDGPGGDPEAIWQRLLLAGEQPAASEALAFEMDRVLGMALGFAHVQHAPSDLVRDGLDALTPAELYQLRMSVDGELADKEAVERGLRSALDGPAPDGLERAEQSSVLARVRAEIAQLLVLDTWAGAAIEGKEMGWPPERWNEEGTMERLWDFHGMQGRLAEALRDYHVLRGTADRHRQRGASPSEDLRLQWNLSEALHRVGDIVRAVELAALDRACRALEIAYHSAWERLAAAPATRQKRVFPDSLRQAVRALDGILLVRAMADRYPPEPGLLLPAGARGTDELRRTGAAEPLPQAGARAEMHDRVLARYVRYREFAAAVTKVMRQTRSAPSTEETGALRAAQAFKKSLGKAYEAYVRAAWSMRMNRLAQTSIAEDLGGHAGQGRAPLGGAAVELRRALDDAEAAIGRADAALLASRADAQALTEGLAPLADHPRLAVLRAHADRLLDGLAFEPGLAPGASAVTEVPAAALAAAADRYTPGLSEIEPHLRPLLAAAHHLELGEPDSDGSAARARLFVLAGPAGLPLSKPS